MEDMDALFGFMHHSDVERGRQRHTPIVVADRGSDEGIMDEKIDVSKDREISTEL